MRPALNITLIVAVCLLVLATAVTTIVTLRRRQELKKESSGKGLPRLLAAHARDFEGLFESLYVSCLNENSFDGDAYNEWCDRAAMSGDEDLRSAFAAAFSKTDDPGECMAYSKKLLELIEDAGIKRTGAPGEKLVYDPAASELFECINSSSPQGKSCTVIKPAWVLDGKAAEPGVVTADR